jgi:hypothetical protein
VNAQWTVDLQNIALSYSMTGPLSELLGIAPNTPSPITRATSTGFDMTHMGKLEQTVVCTPTAVHDPVNVSTFSASIHPMPLTDTIAGFQAKGMRVTTLSAPATATDGPRTLTTTSWAMTLLDKAPVGKVTATVTGGAFVYDVTYTWSDPNPGGWDPKVAFACH